ncbi:MAG: Rrf2 family transcriptional regulator [Gemmatales bacterium]|nr:MAG: Rrf2 family transcriptional regulator [Gemmatales bacterium]
MEDISLLPQTAEYALRVVVWLAAHAPAKATSRSLAKATGIPLRYQYRVLQALGREGIVQSRSGPGGGYELARPANQITMLDVINAVGRIRRIRTCPLARGAEGSHLCPLHRELDAAFAQIEQAFARVSIGQLVRRASRPLCEA